MTTGSDESSRASLAPFLSSSAVGVAVPSADAAVSAISVPSDATEVSEALVTASPAVGAAVGVSLFSAVPAP